MKALKGSCSSAMARLKSGIHFLFDPLRGNISLKQISTLEDFGSPFPMLRHRSRTLSQSVLDSGFASYTGDTKIIVQSRAASYPVFGFFTAWTASMSAR